MFHLFEVNKGLIKMADICRIFNSSSNLLKGCGVLLGVTLVVHCVGIGTNYWYKFDLSGISNHQFHTGLFQTCFCSETYHGSRCICNKISSELAPGWHKGVQALEIVGLLAIICVGFLIFMQLFCTQSTSIKIWGILLIALAGLCIFGGVILYGAEMRENLSFSFGLCVVSALLCFVCSVLLFQDRRISKQNPRSPDQIHYANEGQIISSPNTQPYVVHPSQSQSPAYPTTHTGYEPPPAMHNQYGPPPSYSVVQQENQFVKH